MKRLFVTGTLFVALAAAYGQQYPVKIRYDVEGAWSDWGLSGNEHKFRQYATAPHGFFLRNLTLGASDDLRNDARFVIKAPGQDDYRATGQVRLNAGTTRIMVSDARNRFSDPDPTIAAGSSRRVSEGYVSQKIGQDFAISYRTRLTDQKETFWEPAETLDQTTRTSNIAARGSLWHNGFVDLSYTDTRYVDRTAVLPNSTTQSLSAGLMQQFGDSLALSGSYSHTTIRQPEQPLDKIDEWNVGANWLVTDDTSLLIDYRKEMLTLPTVAIAYDRARQEARARLVRRLGSGWSIQFGYDQLALERVTDNHDFVDVPRLHTFDTQFSGRLSRTSRITATLSRQVMQGGAQMQLSDPRGLYWTSRWDGQLKLDAHNALATAYLVLDWHQNRNSQRDVTVRHQGLTLGAEWSLRPELEFYSEISTDLWSGHTSDPLSPDLNTFFPDATTLTSGANWTINPRTWATANYTFFNSQNDNPLHLPHTSVWGSFFTGTVHYKVGNDYELGLTFAPWQYSDLAAGRMGYGTGMIQITARAKY